MAEKKVPDFSAFKSPPRQSLDYQQLELDQDPIGEGGQGVVYRADIAGSTQPDKIAVKEPVVDNRTLSTDTFQAFLEEASTWEMLDRQEREKPRWRDSEHIVGVIDTGDEIPWIAMEFMDGGSLHDRLEEDPDGLPINEALWIGECICQGVEIAHNNGIAHLDLKPANILFQETPDGKWKVPKIADWGLARVLAEQTSTREGLSVKYAAPEQFEPDEFGDPDMLTDVYQVGALVYAMLTGEPPHTGRTASIINNVVSGDEPDPPGAYRCGLSDVIDEAILLALETKKTDRYPNIKTLEQAFQAIRTDGPLPPSVVQQLDSTNDRSITSEKNKETAHSIPSELDVVIIGCGSAGGNTVTRLMEESIKNAHLVAADTSAQHLAEEVKADSKILLGRQRTGGRGAGSEPTIGKESAQENIDAIRELVKGSDVVFVSAGLGGGTGTGATPVIVQAAQDMGALAVPIVTLPFSGEGEIRRSNAEAGLKHLSSVSDLVITIPNDTLVETEKLNSAPVSVGFDMIDILITRLVKHLTKLITNPGVIETDIDDFRAIIEDSGVSNIGLSRSESENRIVESAQQALRSPFLSQLEEDKPDSVLVSILTDSNTSLEDSKIVLEKVHNRFGPDANIEFGVNVNTEFNNMAETLVMPLSIGHSNKLIGTESSTNQRFENIDQV
jgi:cell division protein FtsZ